jgi:hypothetical protein
MFCKSVLSIFNKDNDDPKKKAGLNELNGLEVELLRVSTKEKLFEGFPLLENPELQYALKGIVISHRNKAGLLRMRQKSLE